MKILFRPILLLLLLSTFGCLGSGSKGSRGGQSSNEESGSSEGFGESRDITECVTPAVLVLRPSHVDPGWGGLHVHDFGIVPVGEVRELNIAVLNGGDWVANDISPSQIPIDIHFKGGSYPGIGGTCGSRLTAYESCMMVVEYRSSTEGAFLNNLHLQYYNGRTPSIASIYLRYSTPFQAPQDGTEPYFPPKEGCVAGDWASNMLASGIVRGKSITSETTRYVQSFNLSHDKRISSVTLKLSKNVPKGPLAKVVVSIFKDDNQTGKPVGVPLATAEIAGSKIGDVIGSYKFTFNPPLDVRKNEPYLLELKAEGGELKVIVNESNSYSEGSLFYTYDGIAWQTQSGKWDFVWSLATCN